MAKTRTFIAIESTDTIRRRAAGLIDRLRPYAPSARWVEEENVHLTLFFLGELGDAELADVCSRAEWAARANAPFAIRVKGVGAFPDVSRPRAVWMGVTEGAEPLKRLQADLEEAVADMAPRGENRGFVPHWTLARLGRRGGGVSPHLSGALANLADYDAGEMNVDEILVMSSELRPEGPEYYPMARCPLGMPG